MLEWNKCFSKIFNVEWHWWRTEYQARGAPHAHEFWKLKDAPNMCKLAGIYLEGAQLAKREKAGELAEWSESELAEADRQIQAGMVAEREICAFVDKLINLWNPVRPKAGEPYMGSEPHPSAREFTIQFMNPESSDYADCIFKFQRHTKCSPGYCLRTETGGKVATKELAKKLEAEGCLHCRFGAPWPAWTPEGGHPEAKHTRLDFEEINTRSKSKGKKYKIKVYPRRNDPESTHTTRCNCRADGTMLTCR